ncbi:MAG TPA: hypothetical protein VHQ87_09105, partial [Rhizobacter sp.]|nr:hypothetical protein [Rhizobacter sp.]
MTSTICHFVLLPTRGFTADEPNNSSATEIFLSTMRAPGVKRPPAPAGPTLARFTVLDSIQSNGAKLVAMSGGELMRLKREQPGVRVVPEVFYPPARAPRPPVLTGAQAFSARATLAQPVIKVVIQGSGKALRAVDVIAFSDFAAQKGAQGTTNAKGEVSLQLPRSVRVLERVYVYPAHSAWPVLL